VCGGIPGRVANLAITTQQRPSRPRTLGATGAIVTVKAIHELHRIGGQYALVTMCIGGGQGIAAIFQSMN